jgi:hypothetical protein
VRVSELVWDAPESINHRDGLSSFLRPVAKAQNGDPLPAPFAEYMDVLYDKLVAIDNILGFYRDKFITHLPQDMLVAGSGGAISVPLNFHMEHRHRREVTEAELRALRKAVRQVEQAEGLNLGLTNTIRGRSSASSLSCLGSSRTSRASRRSRTSSRSGG